MFYRWFFLSAASLISKRRPSKVSRGVGWRRSRKKTASDISPTPIRKFIGNKKCAIWHRLSTPVAFDALLFRNGATYQKSKQLCAPAPICYFSLKYFAHASPTFTWGHKVRHVAWNLVLSRSSSKISNKNVYEIWCNIGEQLRQWFYVFPIVWLVIPKIGILNSSALALQLKQPPDSKLTFSHHSLPHFFGRISRILWPFPDFIAHRFYNAVISQAPRPVVGTSVLVLFFSFYYVFCLVHVTD